MVLDGRDGRIRNDFREWGQQACFLLVYHTAVAVALALEAEAEVVEVEARHHAVAE